MRIWMETVYGLFNQPYVLMACYYLFIWKIWQCIKGWLKKTLTFVKVRLTPPPHFYFLLWQNVTKIWHFKQDFCYFSTKNCHYRHYFWQIVTYIVVQKFWSIFVNFLKTLKTGGSWPPPPTLKNVKVFFKSSLISYWNLLTLKSGAK